MRNTTKASATQTDGSDIPNRRGQNGSIERFRRSWTQYQAKAIKQIKWVYQYNEVLNEV